MKESPHGIDRLHSPLTTVTAVLCAAGFINLSNTLYVPFHANAFPPSSLFLSLSLFSIHSPNESPATSNDRPTDYDAVDLPEFKGSHRKFRTIVSSLIGTKARAVKEMIWHFARTGRKSSADSVVSFSFWWSTVQKLVGDRSPIWTYGGALLRGADADIHKFTIYYTADTAQLYICREFDWYRHLILLRYLLKIDFYRKKYRSVGRPLDRCSALPFSPVNHIEPRPLLKDFQIHLGCFHCRGKCRAWLADIPDDLAPGSDLWKVWKASTGTKGASGRRPGSGWLWFLCLILLDQMGIWQSWRVHECKN